MLTTKDLVCANIVETVDGKEVKTAKSAPFTKTYFEYDSSDEITTRDKQFNGKVIGQVEVPKEDKSSVDVDTNYSAMLGFFASKYPKVDPKLTVMELVTSAYDIQQRAPAAIALKPRIVDETKVFETTARNFAAMGGIVDPTSGEKVTDVADIISVLKAMAGK